MIIDAIGGALIGAVTWLVSLLPTGSIMLDEFSGIWYGYAQLNTWLPLTEVLACIVAYIGLQATIYGYLVIRAVRNWLPFV